MSVQGKKRSASGSESLRGTPAYGAIVGTEPIPELLLVNEVIEDPSKSVAPVLNKITNEMRFASWDRWIGPTIIKGRCFACKQAKIKRDTFQCMPLEEQSILSFETIRPVCMSCYCLMKINNFTLNTYMQKLDL